MKSPQVNCLAVMESKDGWRHARSRTKSGLEGYQHVLAKFFGMMVARDGVEPPTPAFSGYLLILQSLASKTCLILSSLLEPKWSRVVKI